MRGILVRDGDAPGPDTETRRRVWALWFASALALAALPVAPVRYPPMLDLPQQLAQIDLLGRALAEPQARLRVQWWQPDRIGYPVLALARWAGGDEWGPRLAVAAVQATWIGSLFLLALRLHRAPESAFLASVFVWQAAFYGGYVHFLVGFAALAAWLLLLERVEAPPSAARLVTQSFLGGLLLYVAHVLWLAAGLGALAVVLAIRRRPGREWALRLLGLAPWLAAAAVFATWLARAGWGAGLRWETNPLERLLVPRVTAAFLLGGLDGPTEVAALAGLALWLAVAVATKGEGARRWHPALAGGGLLLLAAALLAPDAMGATALFACRWGPPAGALLLLAAPVPRPWLRRALAAAVVAAFSLATTVVWRRYDARYSRGFDEVLARIGAGERVLGLDFDRRAPGLRMETMMHMAAYAQVERRAEIGYSFARVPTSLVVDEDEGAPGGEIARLRHLPGSLAPEHLGPFDHVLLCAGPEVEEEFVRRFQGFAPVIARGRWRLLRRAGEGGAPETLSAAGGREATR